MQPSPNDAEHLQIPMHTLDLETDDEAREDQEEGQDSLPLLPTAQTSADTLALRKPRSCRLRHYLISFVSVFLLVFVLDYLYSEPITWARPWYLRFLDPQPTLISPVVRAAGVKFKGNRNRTDDEFLSFVGIRYAHSPVAERRFRNAVAIDVGIEKSEADWIAMNVTDAMVEDGGCPRPDPEDATKASFIGTEDCLKYIRHVICSKSSH